MPLFALSIAVLGYAHYRVWIRGFRHRTGTILLIVNTALVTSFWVWRLPF